MIIYWTIPTSGNDFFLGLDEPKPVISTHKNFLANLGNNSPFTNFFHCPSYKSFTKNLFSLHSPIDLEFSFDGDYLDLSGFYDYQPNFITIRDIQSRQISLGILPFIFFAEKPCEMQFSGPIFGTNNFSSSCLVIPGQLNIGRWFRPLDLAFFAEENLVNIKQGDELCNVRFLTSEKIVFKKFWYSDFFDDVINKESRFRQFINAKGHTYLENLYTLFHKSYLQKKILQEIKKNLIN